MRSGFDKNFYLKIVSILFFISGIVLFQESVAGFEQHKFVLSIIVALVISAFFSFLNFENSISFFSGASFGSVNGFAYGFVLGVLSLCFSCFLARRFFSQSGKFCSGLSNAECLLLSYTLSFAGSYPFLKSKMTFLFFLFQLLLNLAFYLFIQRLLIPDSKQLQEKVLTESLFLAVVPVSSYAIAAELWMFPLISVALLIAARFSAERFFFFDRLKFMISQAEYVSTNVYGDSNFLISAESLSRALEAETGNQIQSEKLYLIILLSSLLWVPFGKPLYRKPENLNQEEYEILRSNLVTLKTMLENCNADPEIIEGVYRIYENYDGTGIPDGLEGEDIPLLSRFSRVLEGYLLLTSWSEKKEPLTDEEAFNEIEYFAGTFFDPNAVKVLKKIVLPESNALSNESEEETIASFDSKGPEQDKNDETV